MHDLPTVDTETFQLDLADHALRVRRIALAHAARRRSTLVFLHDSLGCIELWRDFPERLARATQSDALVYDRRGYGGSSPFHRATRTVSYLEDEADVVAVVLERCGVDNAILFGHSDGGSIALVAAARYPGAVEAVITEGAHVFVEERTLEGVRAARKALATTDLRTRLERYHGERTDAVTAAWIDTWLAPEFRDWNIEVYLPRIRRPVLVLQGANDEFGTDAQVDAIVRGVGVSARSHMFPGVGHTPHRDAAAEVVDVTAAFLAAHLPLT